MWLQSGVWRQIHDSVIQLGRLRKIRRAAALRAGKGHVRVADVHHRLDFDPPGAAYDCRPVRRTLIQHGGPPPGW